MLCKPTFSLCSHTIEQFHLSYGVAAGGRGLQFIFHTIERFVFFYLDFRDFHQPSLLKKFSLGGYKNADIYGLRLCTGSREMMWISGYPTGTNVK